MIELKYGVPPAIEDCVDLGTAPLEVAPYKFENAGRFAGNPILHNEFVQGADIPPHRRAWMVVSHYRPGVRSGDIPREYTVNVPGLGRLRYGMDEMGDNWIVE